MFGSGLKEGMVFWKNWIRRNKKKLVLAISFCLCLMLASLADTNPQEVKGELQLEADFLGSNIVYVTAKGQTPDKSNKLKFYIKSAGPAKRKPAIPAITTKSYFKISFDYGNGPGDLATRKTAKSYILNFTENYDSNYDKGDTHKFEVKSSKKSVRPFWRVIAESDTFFGEGSKNRIVLEFTNIFSYQKPGLATMHIEYVDIPGFQDGYCSLNIIKAERPEPKAMAVKKGLHVGEGDFQPEKGILQIVGNATILGNLQLKTGASVNEFSNDVTLARNSDLVVPTEKAVRTYMDNRLPRGVIVMWYGKANEIPSGWALCAGQEKDIPDLRGRFILGVKEGETPGETGGSDKHKHTVDPHKHLFVGTTDTYSAGGKVGVFNGIVAAEHKHKFSGTTRFESKTMNVHEKSHLPPYYKLAFIMKL